MDGIFFFNSSDKVAMKGEKLPSEAWPMVSSLAANAQFPRRRLGGEHPGGVRRSRGDVLGQPP